jgi:hypothetical protein
MTALRTDTGIGAGVAMEEEAAALCELALALLLPVVRGLDLCILHIG